MLYLSAFTVPFLFALALWPVVSVALTVPVLAMLYHRDNRLGLPAILSAYGTVLYAIGLLCFTLGLSKEKCVLSCVSMACR